MWPVGVVTTIIGVLPKRGDELGGEGGPCAARSRN
jgi:hypothetical protein